MKVSVKTETIYKVTGPNGKEKEFRKAGSVWNGFTELVSSDNLKLILCAENSSVLDPWFEMFGEEKDYNVVRASLPLVMELGLNKIESEKP